MRIFGGDKLFSVFNSPMFASIPDNEPLTQSGMLTNKVTNVQKQVEGHNFDVRKHILEYDDVMNKHREVIYGRRNKILDAENIDEDIKEMIDRQVSGMVVAELARMGDEPDKKEVIKKVNTFLGKQILDDTIEHDDIAGIDDSSELWAYIARVAKEDIEQLKNKATDTEAFYSLERRIVLKSIDELWMRHIDAMTRLREEVAFEGYAQKNPLVVYKEKAFGKFDDLMHELEYKVVKAMFAIQTVQETQIEPTGIDESDLELNDTEVTHMLDGVQKWTQAGASRGNPLFTQPQRPQTPPKTNQKQRIRV